MPQLFSNTDYISQDANDGLWLGTGRVEHVHLRDVLLFTSAVTLIGQPDGSGTGGLFHSKFEDVRVQHGYGVTIGSGSNNYPLRDLDFDRLVIDAAQQPFLMQGAVYHCRFRGGVFHGPAPYGGGLDDPNNSSVFQTGVSDVGGFSPETVVFIGTTFRDAEYGLWLRSAHDFHFINCWFDNLRVGIHAEASTVRLTNCMFKDVTRRFVEQDSTSKCVVDGYTVQGAAPASANRFAGTGSYVTKLGDITTAATLW